MSDDIRKRLKKLNRGPLRESHQGANSGRKYSQSPRRLNPLPSVFRKPSVIRAAGPPFIELREVVTGDEVCNQRGKFLLTGRDMAEFVADSDDLNAAYTRFIGGSEVLSDDVSLSGDFKALLRTEPSRVLYLDIETTGLSSTPLFLVGTMFLNDNRFCIQQLFAREYCEEAALIEYLKEFARNYDCLVTFNGKSFDIPFIRSRAVTNMTEFNWNEAHLDLLHEARRRYRSKLENCKLQTLEAEICGRSRTGDIPGSEIPDAYHSFVRTGNAYKIQNILYHNALDLITMAELLLNMLSAEE